MQVRSPVNDNIWQLIQVKTGFHAGNLFGKLKKYATAQEVSRRATYLVRYHQE